VRSQRRAFFFYAASHQPVVIRANCYRIDRALVAKQNYPTSRWVSGDQIPESRRAVRTTGGQPAAVRADRQRSEIVLVSMIGRAAGSLAIKSHG
jgi:hypothetical protein